MKKLIQLALMVLALTVLLSTAAQAVPERPPVPKNSRVTVGVRTSGASAADNRGDYQYEIAPRAVKEDFIALYNYAYTPVTVRLLPLDASNTVNGDFTVQPSAAKPVDAGAWIVAAHTTVALKPRSMTIVPFQVGVPYNATPGDHVGSLMVSLLARAPGKNSGVIVEHRVGLRVYIRVPGALKSQLTVEHLKTTFSGIWTPLGLGTTDVSYAVHNTGNVRLQASQVVSIAPALGLSGASASPARIVELLPGGVVEVHQSFPTRFAGIGSLKATVTLHARGVDPSIGSLAPVVATTSVFVFPWLLLLILLAIGVGGYLWWRRKRKKTVAGSTGSHRSRDVEAPADRQPALTGTSSAPGKRVRTERRSAALGAVVIAMLAIGGVGVGIGSASATPAPKPWQATVYPTSGTDDQPFSIRTSGACPQPARSVIGRVYGAGFPAGGVNVIGNSSGGVSQVGGFEMPLQETLRDTMVQQKTYVPLHGIYKLVIRCIIPAYIDRSYGDYVVKINFVTQHRWVAEKPVTLLIGPHMNPDGSIVGPHLPGKTGALTPANVHPAAPPSPTPTSPNPSANGSTGGSQNAATSGGTDFSSVALIIGGVLVAGGAVFLLVRGRS